MITSIEEIICGDRTSRIRFIDCNSKEGVLVFDCTYDLKYSTEDGFIVWISEIPKEVLRKNSIYVIDGSKYLEYFKHQTSGTLPLERMNVCHYVVLDVSATGVEILASKHPVLTWL
jgi:hypothetical protein